MIMNIRVYQEKMELNLYSFFEVNIIYLVKLIKKMISDGEYNYIKNISVNSNIDTNPGE